MAIKQTQRPRVSGLLPTPTRHKRMKLGLIVLAALAVIGTGAFLLNSIRYQGALVVAVDPGHGGTDPGAAGSGLDEYQVTWQTAQYLMELLKEDKRFKPILTITKKESQNSQSSRITPSQRAQRAREKGAGLFVSIHCNSDGTGEAYGFECYPVPPGRTHHQQSMLLAQSIADAFGQQGARLRGTQGLRYVYYNQQDEKRFVEIQDDTVQADLSFTVLEESGCPAVLAEQCFITNTQDAQRFASQEGCQQAAQLYYQGICAWYEQAGLG